MHDRKLTACDDDTGLTTPTESLEETALPGQSSPPCEMARHDLVDRLSLAAAARGAPSISLDTRSHRASSAANHPLPSGVPGAAVAPGDGETCPALLPAAAAQVFPFAVWATGSVHRPQTEPNNPPPADDQFSAREALTAGQELPVYPVGMDAAEPPDPARQAEGPETAPEAGPDTYAPDSPASGVGQTPQHQPADDGPVEPGHGTEDRQDQVIRDTGPELSGLSGTEAPSGYVAPPATQGPDAGHPSALEVPEPRAAPPARRRGALRLLAAAARIGALVLALWFATIVLLIVLFRFVDPPTSALILLRKAQGVSIDQRWTPLGKISPNLVHAVITSEDSRFCSHWGIDPQEVAAAISRSARGRPRGASTMTMQLAKNLFLWPHYSYVRKALEVPLTLIIEAVWPKRRIAEVYLNIVEWGPGIFGAEAAAQRNFKRSAQKLTAQQAALLAVTLPSPGTRKPASPSRLMNKMASTIMARMRASPSVDDCVISPR